MGGACAPIRSPPGISGTGHPARVYPEAWQAGKAPVGRPLRQRPGAPAQHRPGVVGHLRGGFFALLTAATDLATKAVPSLSGVTSSRSAVNHLLKSVVREICTLRSVGTGGGRPPPVTRWVASRGVPLSRSRVASCHSRSGWALPPQL